MQKITESIQVQYGVRGCNVGCVTTSEGIVMIESPMVPEDALKLRDEISRLGKVRYLINTEPHQDHFSGNYYFEGTVVGHEGSREAILSASIDQMKGMLKQMAPESAPLEKDFHFRAPTITFSQRLTIYLGKHTFKLINMPGHTPFEVAVYIPEERVVFTGDNVVNGTMPFLHEALPYAWLESLQKLQQMEVDYIIPGHGKVCDKSYLVEMSSIVKAWIDVVKKAIDQGLSVVEAQKTINMLDRSPGDKQRMAWVQNINIANLYQQLKKEKPRS